MSEPHDRGSTLVQRLCGPFLTELAVTGALISVTDGDGLRTGVAVSDPVAARWDELELQLGSGPLTDATVRSEPQLIDDVSTGMAHPVLSADLSGLGIRALFALPLMVGSATVGVVGLYRDTTGGLSPQHLARALDLSRATAVPAVRAALRAATTDTDETDPDDRGGLRREVHQATGMLSATLDITITDAFARLRARATSSGRSINALSADIVSGALDASRFDDD